jgi:hypothetical protein
MPTGDDVPPPVVNVSTLSPLAGFQLTAYGRFWVTAEVFEIAL